MTTDSVLSPAPVVTKVDRRVAWLVIVLATLSLVLLAINAWQDGGAPWWSWALPVLLIVSTSTSTFGLLRRWPRLNRAFPFVLVVVAAAIVVAQVGRFR